MGHKYKNEDIIEFSKTSKSCAGLLRKLGIRPEGANYSTIKNKLKELNIDCSHWTGQGWNKGLQLKEWGKYRNTESVKEHLIKRLGRVCESCKRSKWLRKDITLELHHVDGNRSNNELDNLRLLCPNCHSITENWRGRNKTSRPCLVLHRDMPIGAMPIVVQKTRKKKIAWPNKEELEKLLSEKSCLAVSRLLEVSPSGVRKVAASYGIDIKAINVDLKNRTNKNRRKSERPPYEQLLEEVKDTSYSAVGRKYGVSDNAIRKWIRAYQECE